MRCGNNRRCSLTHVDVSNKLRDTLNFLEKFDSSTESVDSRAPSFEIQQFFLCERSQQISGAQRCLLANISFVAHAISSIIHEISC